jgi:hypothetical protein
MAGFSATMKSPALKPKLCAFLSLMEGLSQGPPEQIPQLFRNFGAARDQFRKLIWPAGGKR